MTLTPERKEEVRKAWNAYAKKKTMSTLDKDSWQRFLKNIGNARLFVWGNYIEVFIDAFITAKGWDREGM